MKFNLIFMLLTVELHKEVWAHLKCLIFMFRIYKKTRLSNVKQFADDSILYKLIFTESDINNFQLDLNNLNEWCSEKSLN